MALLDNRIELHHDADRGRAEPHGPSEARLADVDRCHRLIARALEACTLPSEIAERTADAVVIGVAFFCMADDCGLSLPGEVAAVTKVCDVARALGTLFRDTATRYGSALLAETSVVLGQAIGHSKSPVEGALDKAVAELFSSCQKVVAESDPRRSADLLGRLYERSLGRAPRSHPRDAAAKAIVRKEGGVFYTPAHVVDYILQRTLGQILEGKTPDEVESVRVLDPACGSGAFLLGAYRALLAWHLRWHVEHDRALSTSGERAAIERTAQGEYRLRRPLRAAILRNGIFGVDLDAQAVDIARLSLLLTCFDDKTAAEDPREEGSIPNLRENLQSGDSLGPDEPRGDTSFAWKTAFARVFAEGGFDVVVGNPPYVSFGGRHAVDIAPELRRYYADHYESGGWPTAHSLFLERSVKLLSRRYVSFVVPDQVGHLAGYRFAREIGQREASLVEVRYWGERVFPGVTTPAMTFVLDKAQKCGVTAIVDRDGTEQRGTLAGGAPWTFSPAAKLIERLRERSFSLGKLVGDCGIRTTSSKTQVVPLSRAEGSFVPVLEGKLVERYGCRPPEFAVRLDSNEPLFVSREERYRDVAFVIRQTASYPIVGPREHALYFRNSLLALFAPKDGLDLRYVVALLNSKLLRFVYTETVREANQRVFPQVKVKALQSLPLRALDLTREAERARHDQLVELVDRALSTQKRAPLAENAPRDDLLRQFHEIDVCIDEVVFDLYQVTPDERAAIDASLAKSARPR